MTESPLAPMLRKLNARATLTLADQAAVSTLPYELRTIAAHGYVVREGDVATHSCLLRAGFAYRQKTTRDGSRQICSLHLSGDMVDLQNSLLRVADHSVQALTQIDVAYIAVEAVLELAYSRPAVGKAMWYDTLVDAAIFREWLTNVGQRSAVMRLAHLLCEFGLRFEAAGLGDRDAFELPMSQEHLGDCTGLTSVHVNRMLKALRTQGLVVITKGAVKIQDWDGLARVGDFSPDYLHLPATYPREH